MHAEPIHDPCRRIGDALRFADTFAVHAIAITQVQNDDPVVPNSQNIVSVSCPAGQKVLGGGTFTNADNADQVNVIVGTRPADGDDQGTKLDDGWTGFHDTGATPAGGASAIALCQGGKVASKLKFRQRQFGIAADSVKTKTVDCPRNYKVTGGGVDASGTFDATEVEGTRPVSMAETPGRAACATSIPQMPSCLPSTRSAPPAASPTS